VCRRPWESVDCWKCNGRGENCEECDGSGTICKLCRTKDSYRVTVPGVICGAIFNRTLLAEMLAALPICGPFTVRFGGDRARPMCFSCDECESIALVMPMIDEMRDSYPRLELDASARGL
jgi:hypothetical protein